MEAEMNEAFTRIKPFSDLMISDPTPTNISNFVARICELKKTTVQELQQYIVFPFLTHISSAENEKKHEVLRRLIDGVRVVLEKITINNFEMYLKLELALLNLVFDKNMPSMIADIPEELKLSAMRCQTVLLLNVNARYREMLMTSQVPLLAQAIFVAIHTAKLDRLRPLRLASLQCVTALTGTHPQITNGYYIESPSFEKVVVDMLSGVLPGIIAGLQDVATCSSNPGHVIIVTAIEAMHRILCTTMNDKFLIRKTELTCHDFYQLVMDKSGPPKPDVSPRKMKDLLKRSPEWYALAAEKLTAVMKSIVSLRSHENVKVRKELAIFSYRVISECSLSMQPSIPFAIDILVSLTKDTYPEVAQYCTASLEKFFKNATPEVKNKTMDSMCDNFFGNLACLPRLMNNIDAGRKSTALNLVAGYVALLSDGDRPQRLTAALSVPNNMQCLCLALLEASSLTTSLLVLRHQFTRDINATPSNKTPWINFRHLESSECEERLQYICRSLGDAECAELLADRLMETFQSQRDPEGIYILNWIAAGSNSPLSLVHRLINAYTEEDLWYLPLEIGSTEKPLTKEETLDPSVYNPRAWIKDSVPGLFEGATEIRYTDISYKTPREPPYREPNTCANLAEAQRNMLLSCLVTDGLGMMAKRLMEGFEPYLMKTLCMVLERVGSPHEMLHLAGIKAINDIATACGHKAVPDLIRCNADYFTNQISIKLKKAWNSESALQILSVVMEYSDTRLLDCLYGIVQDILVQSCDRYYEKNLDGYLQVFLTFVQCIRRWFNIEGVPKEENTQKTEDNIDILKDVREYVKNIEQAEMLLSNDEWEKESGKTVEEMYKEDMKKKQEDIMDYDDSVADEKSPPPQHVLVAATVLKRSLHFVSSRSHETASLSMQILSTGLPVLAKHEDLLLPIVHLTWAPFVTKFTATDAPVMLCGFELLTTMSWLAKSFIRVRTLKEILPCIYKFLDESSRCSRLKDTGSAYRLERQYRAQEAALRALPRLAADLRLEDERLSRALAAAQPYLSNRQPKPLQALAVYFYKHAMTYDYGVVWRHLAELCGNQLVLPPPANKTLKLEAVVGTPFYPSNSEYKHNIQHIFENRVT